jgi:hypothetical protein
MLLESLRAATCCVLSRKSSESKHYYFHARSDNKVKDEKFSGGSPNIPEVRKFAEHLKILGSAEPQPQVRCTPYL